MRVKATKLLFYGCKRMKPGEVFDLVEVRGKEFDPKTGKIKNVVLSPERQFSQDAMERVEEVAKSDEESPIKPKVTPTGDKKVI